MPPPQHVEIGSDRNGGITLKVFYKLEDKEKGEKNLLIQIPKKGVAVIKDLPAVQEKVEKQGFELSRLIKITKDRGWMKEVTVGAATAQLLKEVSQNKKLSLEDNYSKTNGFYVLSNGERVGVVTVVFNEHWEEDFRKILTKLK
jgi:hypothetical protein